MFFLIKCTNLLVLTVFLNVGFLSTVTGILTGGKFLWGKTNPVRTTMVPIYPSFQCAPSPPCDLGRCQIQKDSRGCNSLCDCRGGCPTCASHCQRLSVSGYCPVCRCPTTQEEACKGFICPPGKMCAVNADQCHRGMCIPFCSDRLLSSYLHCHATCPMSCAKISIEETCFACLCWTLQNYPSWFLGWYQVIIQDKIAILREIGYMEDSDLKQWFLLFISFLNLHKLDIQSPEVFKLLFIKFVKFMKENHVNFASTDEITILFTKFFATVQAPKQLEPEASTKLYLTNWFDKLKLVFTGSEEFNTEKNLSSWFKSFLQYVANQAGLIRDPTDLEKYLVLFSNYLKTTEELQDSERRIFVKITLAILMHLRKEKKGNELIECQRSCPFYCAKIEMDADCSACLCSSTTEYPSWYYEWFHLIEKDSNNVLSQTSLSRLQLKNWFLLFIYFRSMHNISIPNEEKLIKIFIQFVKYMKDNNLDFSQMNVITTLFQQFATSFQTRVQAVPEEFTKKYLSDWFENVQRAFVLGSSSFKLRDGLAWFEAFLNFIAEKKILIRDKDDLRKWLTAFSEHLKTSSTLPQNERSHLLEITIFVEEHNKKITSDFIQCQSSPCPYGCISVAMDSSCSLCLCLGADTPTWFTIWFTILKEKMQKRELTALNTIHELRHYFYIFVNFMNLHKIDIDTEDEFVRVFEDFVNFMKSRSRIDYSIEQIRTLYVEFEQVIKKKYIIKSFIKNSKVQITSSLKKEHPELPQHEIDIWFKKFLDYITFYNITIDTEVEYQAAIEGFINSSPEIRDLFLTHYVQSIVLVLSTVIPTWEIETEPTSYFYPEGGYSVNETVVEVENRTKVIMNTTEVIYVDGNQYFANQPLRERHNVYPGNGPTVQLFGGDSRYISRPRGIESVHVIEGRPQIIMASQKAGSPEVIMPPGMNTLSPAAMKTLAQILRNNTHISNIHSKK